MVLRLLAGKTTDQRDGDGDASRGRDKILNRESGHLHEITECGFSAISLPVGIRHETDCRIKRQVRT